MIILLLIFFFYKASVQNPKFYNLEILTAMRVMVVSIGSRGSHIPAMTPKRLRRGVIAGISDSRDPIETTMTRIFKQSIFLLYTEQYVFYTPK